MFENVGFADPLLLLALALLPLFVIAYVVRRRRGQRYAVRFPAFETLAAVATTVPAWRRHLPPALFLGALALLLVALARPEREVSVAIDRATVVLVNDTSLSMEADDVQPTRLTAARRAGERFLDSVPDGLRVGSIAFSTDVQVLETPTYDLEEVRNAVRSLQALGGTATGEGLAAALTLIREEGETREGRRPPAAIVLLSDGATTSGRDPVGVAQQARRLRVPIYTVALGTSEGVVTTPTGQTIAVPPDPETMRKVASTSGGRAFTAEDVDELDEVYESLGSRIGRKTETREFTVAFVGGGLLLLLAAAGTSLRWAGRLP